MKEPISGEGLFEGNFNDFPLQAAMRKGIAQAGYERPTLVQNKTFNPIYSGNDIVVQSPTGSGKTAAFLLPLAAKIISTAPQQEESIVAPSVLVLAPTRELAGQICSECQKLGHEAGLKVLAVYGGASLDKQIEGLRQGAHIVIATPGRLKDMMQRGVFKPESIRHCVLDEADEMLSKGFWDDVLHILDALPSQRQLLLFSATLPQQIRQACSYLMRDPVRVDCGDDGTSPPDVTHALYVENDAWPKPRNLLYVLELAEVSQGIIFCNRRDETELLERYLSNFAYRARALNGDMPQRVREQALDSIRDGKLDFLVATDVAARGIDISSLSHVINYGLPESEEVYVHRTGRTGRMGKKGAAISLIRTKDFAYVDRLKSGFDLHFVQHRFPPEQEILAQQSGRVLKILGAQARHVECGQYLPLATTMLRNNQAASAVAFLLRSYYVAQSSQRVSSTQVPDHRASRHPSDARRAAVTKTTPAGAFGSTRSAGSSQRSPRSSSAGRSQESRVPARTETPRPSEQRRELPSARSTRTDGARSDRSDRSNLPAHKPIRLYINLGKDDGFADLVSLAYAMSERSEVDLGKFTGVGNVREQSSHVEIDAECAQKVITALNGQTHEDKTITCQLARSTRAPAASSFYGRTRRTARTR